MTFWLFTIGLSTVIAGFLILVLRSTRTAQTGTEAEISFYKAQLTDIERDTARGILDRHDAEQMHAKIGRKILRLDSSRFEPAPPKALKPSILLSFIIALAVIGGSHLLYLQLGEACDG